jgi:lactate dehydrogenase-like 2-hydroxyacid dehydrogenase
VRAAAETVRAVLTNGRGGLSGAEMALLPKLEIVCAVGAGYEAVDLDAARRRGIVVAHCPDANAPAVADSAMMLLMATTRHLLQADRFVRAGGWQEHWRVETPTMTGKRLGMLGLGNIGSRIAQRAARGFDMAIGYHTRAAVAGSPYRYFDSLIELATWADFLICAAPGGAGTRHLINAEVLAALGPHGYLVNVGRGTVVDTQALLAALRAQRIAGAGLDVLEGEPSVPPLLPEHCTRHEQAIDLRLDLRNAHFILGQFEHILHALCVAETLAEALDDPRRLGRVSLYMANYFLVAGQYARALASSQRARALASHRQRGSLHTHRGAQLPRSHVLSARGLSSGHRRQPASHGLAGRRAALRVLWSRPSRRAVSDVFVPVPGGGGSVRREDCHRRSRAAHC